MKICSLFSPYYGVGRSASCIKRGAIWAATPLERAARAGALCIVTRTKSWKLANVATDASKEIPQVEASLEGEDEWEAWDGMPNRVVVLSYPGLIRYAKA